MSISVNDSTGMVFGKMMFSPLSVLDHTMQYIRLTACSFLPAPKDQFDHGNNAGTVVLIPGFTQGGSSMEKIGDELSEKYNVVYVGNLPWYTANVKTLTSMILDKFYIAERNEKNQNISVLGHSFGGVLGAVMVSETPDIRVNQMVTVASPHDKVQLSSLIPGVPVLREMESNIYRSCPVIQKKQLKSLTTIAAGNDIVVPTDSQDGKHLPMSSKISKNHEIWEDYGHFSFLESKGAKRVAQLFN